MPTGLDVVRKRLRQFAEHEAPGESPLYAHLALAAAGDDEVADLLTAAEIGQARATLLLAAAHRLVLAEPVCELAYYYPTVGGEYGVDDRVWPLFREFVLDRADRMRALIAKRATQTNEVRRAALLFPAVAIAAKAAGGPIGLLEVGASAGLLLGLDRYGYRYQIEGGEQVTAGPTKAPLVVTSTMELAEGANKPKLPRKITVGAKVGLDHRPVDLADEEELAWLEACVWADQPERVRLLNMAATAQQADRPEMVQGDLVADLATAADRIPAELPLVVLSSHVLPYVPAERRPDFVAALAELAATRPLWWVSQEVYEVGLQFVLPERDDLKVDPSSLPTQPLSTLGLVRWDAGVPVATALARTSAHGEWLRWLA
jgi:hypothetical protein